MPTIERISHLSPTDFFERFATQGKPVIITDAMRDWKCRTLWSDEYFIAKLAGRKFLVNKSSNGAFGIYSSRMRDIDNFVQVDFREFLELMNHAVTSGTNDAIYYMQQKTIQETFPELIEDIDYAPFFDKEKIRDINLWFSQQESNIPLHFDTFDNLLAQVRGSKRIKLLSPDQSKYLYPGCDGAEFASRVDLDHLDVNKFPLARMAETYCEFSLNEGEILYIPSFWWHHVTTESCVSLSINYWYHVINGCSRDAYLAVRDIWRIGLYYLNDLPASQKQLAIRECRQHLDDLMSCRNQK